jgi:hypothetical protein
MRSLQIAIEIVVEILICGKDNKPLEYSIHLDNEKQSPCEIFTSVRERCKTRSEAYWDAINF